jgi:hypothetical protein
MRLFHCAGNRTSSFAAKRGGGAISLQRTVLFGSHRCICPVAARRTTPMNRSRPTRLAALVLCIAAAVPAPALGATQTVYFDTLTAASTAPPLAAADVLFINTHIRGQTGALSHAVTFSVAAGVTGVSGRATWAVSTLAGPGPRLVGVNFDLFNSSNALVLSDTFSGTLGGGADSTFASTPLAPGIYTLRATGNGVRASVYDLALEFSGTPPSTPAGETGSLPLQGATTSAKSVFFTTLQDTRTIAVPVLHNETLLVDTLVTTQVGPLAQTVNFTPSPGIDRFTGEVVWMLSDAIGTGPRLGAVNVDVVDADGVLVASDDFSGTTTGFGHSTLTGFVGAGTHRILVTGDGARDAALGLSLSLIDDEGVFANGFE